MCDVHSIRANRFETDRNFELSGNRAGRVRCSTAGKFLIESSVIFALFYIEIKRRGLYASFFLSIWLLFVESSVRSIAPHRRLRSHNQIACLSRFVSVFATAHTRRALARYSIQLLNDNLLSSFNNSIQILSLLKIYLTGGKGIESMAGMSGETKGPRMNNGLR